MMHYYQHHIGDFIRDTARLDNDHCMTYLRMIWMYYDAEAPLVDDVSVLSIRLGANKEVIASLLASFFKKTDGGWLHDRCERELASFKKMSDGGKLGAAKRWGSGGNKVAIAPPSPPQCDPNANQEPRTNNQETPTSPSGFEEFWKAYPKKKGKGAAEKEWKKAKINGSFPKVIAAVESQKNSHDWRKDGGQFIPYPATWISRRQWEDELDLCANPASANQAPKNGDIRNHPQHGSKERFIEGTGWVLTA